MADILERYDLTVVDSGSDHTILESISVGLDEAYTIFTAICETVYRCDPSDVTEATIRFDLSERDTISWVDVE